MKFQFEVPSDFRFCCRFAIIAVGLLIACPSSQLLADDSPVKFPLKPEHGPWLVFAMSFDGHNSKSQAEQLATELRRDYKLQAYCMSKKLDFTQPIVGAGFDANGNNRKMKFRDKKVIDGYAVLIGDFDSIDSTATSETLATVKHITPKTLQSSDFAQQDFEKTNSISVNSWRDFLRKKAPDKPGPMASAFTTRNPLLPEDFYRTPEVDQFVKKLNEERAHSEFNLLGCPGKFTVRVAVFSGEDRSVGGWGGSGSHQDIDEQKVSQLEIAAEKAAMAAKALRKAGYEAYQFHDRSQSIVTVGSFNELGKADARNRVTYDPGIQEIVARFGATNQVTRTAKYGTTLTPRVLLDLVDQKKIPEIAQGDEKSRHKWFAKYSIPFDVLPAPMAVPRPSASSIYGGSLLGKDRR